MRTPMRWTAVSLAGVLFLAGCSGGGADSASDSAGAADIANDSAAEAPAGAVAQDVTSTLERLADYGTVADVNLARTDVTMQVRDLEARIRALNLSIARMEDLLARATTTTDLVNAEQMLTDRQSELESLLSQQALLADQVSMSTLDIQMWTVESAPEPEPEPATGFWAGLVNGWNSFYDTGSSALMVIGAMLPWLVFFALLALVVVVIRRPLKRRQAAMRLSAASQGPAGQGPTTALPPMGAPAQYGYPAPVGQPWQGQSAPERGGRPGPRALPGRGSSCARAAASGPVRRSTGCR